MSNAVNHTVSARQRWRTQIALFLGHDKFLVYAERTMMLLMVIMAVVAYFVLSGRSGSTDLLSPPLAATLLVLNLLPAISLLVLLGWRLAKKRAANSSIASNGRLHSRLVALFSLIASIPMLLVVIFASLLFQYGVEFWFSDRARGMLENANDLARGYYEQNRQEVGEETVTMAEDLRNYLGRSKLDSPEFAEAFVFQVLYRKLNESAIVELGKDGVPRTAAVVDPQNKEAKNRISKENFDRLLKGENLIVTVRANKIEAVTLLDRDSQIFLYASRDSDLLAFSQWERAQAVLSDYDALFERSRYLQLQFNIALYFASLLIIGIAVWIALAVADRVVRPVAALVQAAQRVTEGDLKARVPSPTDLDEIGTLGRAFNRMTERLESQTEALLGANDQLENRRAFIETVLESVTAGIISLNDEGEIRLINTRAQELLGENGESLLGGKISKKAPELALLMDDRSDTSVVQINRVDESLTLAVRIVRRPSGHVLTFEDITQQLVDQRRAAWSDVARRIAHEIKNPLTPIQLAAERLQRRFGQEIESEPQTFSKLTKTIVRQVGDLRKIVDEFSSFARMPKPVFRRENLFDIAKHSLFLHEVANPEIKFSISCDEPDKMFTFDRRQIGQAVTNIIKNAIEAIDGKAEKTMDFARSDGTIELSIGKKAASEIIVLKLQDNGIGLPEDRDTIMKPYVTTREKGTGLGLAIVKKIVEEHFGEVEFTDNETGGTTVTMSFNMAVLERMENPSETPDEDISNLKNENGN